MAGNSIGHILRLTTFGESHATAIGGIIDGFPAGIFIDLKKVQYELDRRRPGQSAIVTQRKEADRVEILSGLFKGRTTGTPIGFLIYNKDQKSKDYSHIKDAYRPSHADFTYDQKYGHRDYRGGGRSSARETACRVVAGAFAKQALALNNIHVHAFVSAVGNIQMPVDPTSLNPAQIDQNIVRCPDQMVAEKMKTYIEQVKKDGDTIGGIVSCVINNVPPGLGEPVFNKLHAELGKAMLSINAVKGFEYGSGFKGVSMKGSEHNDTFYSQNEKIQTKSNFSGGIQGGISNGQQIYFNVAFKPVATIMHNQESVDQKGNETTVEGKGRHDPCVVPRAVPIVDAMAAITILDHLLLNQSVQLNE